MSDWSLEVTLHEDVVVVVASVLAAGVLAQWIGWRFGVPAIVFLLAGGLVAGPITGALSPDQTFGDLLFPSVSLAVAVILFEGALGLGGRGVRTAGRTVWLLLTVGAFVTVVGTACAARYVLNVGWDLAALIAAVLVVTGPTVIGPIIRAVGLHGRLGAILEAEGTLIDPLGAILTVLVFEALFQGHHGVDGILGELVVTVLVGGAVGALAAGALVVAFARYWIPDQLHNVTSLSLVIGAFALANGVRAESGLVAVTVMGVVLASQRRVQISHVLEFNETLRILFISALFILLGARIEADTLRQLEWRNIVFLMVLILAVRPVSAWLSTIRSGLSGRERWFLALTAPRGIVAAAIASIFSLQLDTLGVENSQVLVSATFTIIAGTVLLSGLGGRFLARRLGLVAPSAQTIVVLGANEFARDFAGALEQQGASVRLVDLDRHELAAARMSGLPVHRGSVFADDTRDLVGLDSASCFVALTSNDELNVLATRHAAAILGRRHVFQLVPRRAEHQAWWTLPTGTFARPLFAVDASYDVLEERLRLGWRITATHLTEQFRNGEYTATHPDAIRLFLVDAAGHVALCAATDTTTPRPGDTVVAVTRPGRGEPAS